MTPEMRGVILDRAIGRCELCARTAHHVHHVTYPKARHGEHPDNLLAVCADCHSLLHGVRPVENDTLKEGKVRTVKDPSGKDMRIIEAAEDIFNTVEEWVNRLYAPDHLRAFLIARIDIEACAAESRGKSGKRMYSGKVVYSSRAVVQALANLRFQMAEQGHTRHAASKFQKAEESRFAPKILELHDYLHDLALEMLAHRRGGVAQQPESSDVGRAITLLSSLLAEHHTTIDDHGKRITVMEATHLRDRFDSITIKVGCLELGLDCNERCRRNGWNIDRAVAEAIKTAGIHATGSTTVRLDTDRIPVPLLEYPRWVVYQFLGDEKQVDYEHFLRRE